MENYMNTNRNKLYVAALAIIGLFGLGTGIVQAAAKPTTKEEILAKTTAVSPDELREAILKETGFPEPLLPIVGEYYNDPAHIISINLNKAVKALQYYRLSTHLETVERLRISNFEWKRFEDGTRGNDYSDYSVDGKVFCGRKQGRMLFSAVPVTKCTDVVSSMCGRYRAEMDKGSTTRVIVTDRLKQKEFSFVMSALAKDAPKKEETKK
jgi:hypothetical protein